MDSNNNKLNIIDINQITKLFYEKIERWLNKLELDAYKRIDDFKIRTYNMVKHHIEMVKKMQERFDTLFELVIKLYKDNNIPMDDILDKALINN
jgi:hypothetical protein